MKKLVLFILLLTGLWANAQRQRPDSALVAEVDQKNYPFHIEVKEWDFADLVILHDTISLQSWIITPTDTFTAKEFGNLLQAYQDGSLAGSGAAVDTIDGNRPITLNINGLQGVNPGTNNLADWVETVFYPSEPPTASLTLTYDGNTSGNSRTLEFDAGTTQNATANYTAGRQSSTTDLSSILVDGISQSFSNPAAGNSVSGTQAISWSSNSNTSISLQVTTADGKTATDQVSINYSWKRYYGFANAPPASSADILALSGNEFASNHSKSYSTGSPSGFQYLVFAYPQSFGALSSIVVNGFPSLSAFTQSTISFTNASGGTATYYIYTSNNQFSSSASVSYD